MSYLDTDTCLHCGKQFIKTRPDRKYCSFNCASNNATISHGKLLESLIKKHLIKEKEVLREKYMKFNEEAIHQIAYNNLRNLLTTAELRSKKFKEIFLNKITNRYEK